MILCWQPWSGRFPSLQAWVRPPGLPPGFTGGLLSRLRRPLKPPEQRVRNHPDAEPQHSPVAIEVSAETTGLPLKKRGKPGANATSFNFSEMIEGDQTAQDECESNQQARIVHVEYYNAPRSRKTEGRAAV